VFARTDAAHRRAPIGLVAAYQRFLALANVPLLVQDVRRSDRRRDRPAGSAAIIRLVRRFRRTAKAIPTASTPEEHLVIVAQLLAVPDSTPGCVVECGCFKGGSTANLSLATALVGRELHVFDSFEGLPPPDRDDSIHRIPQLGEAHAYEAGMYAGSEEEVRATIECHGEISVCHFHKGWFDQTLQGFDEPLALAFLDVDLRSSLETCVRALWPQLISGGRMFVHEARHLEIASLFFDDGWWRDALGTAAPGLVGAGCGLGLTPGPEGWRSWLGYAIKLDDDSYRVRRG
jgi:O-methyltransferase